MIDKELKKITKEMAVKIGDSAVFLCIFNEHMIEEVIPLIQMGLAVYMDKPILLLMPECRLPYVPDNMRRLAQHIETFDDTLQGDLLKSAFEAAITRLVSIAKSKES